MAAQSGKVDKSRNQDDPAHAGTPDKKPDDEANDDHHSHQHGRAPSFTGKRFPLSMTKPHRPLAIRHPFRNRRCLFLFRRTLRPRQQKRRFLGTGALLHLPPRRHAEEASGCATQHTSSTGRRARVYFAPRLPALCSLNRRSMSVVTPQYNVASAHRSR